MNEMQLPERISFNYEELKQELTEKVSMYETMIYTDEQIKEAKADKVNLNKLKKALNDERIRREKEYMQPFNDFKTKVAEIISIIDKPVAAIDRQVKEYEEKQKQDKLAKIKDFFEKCNFHDFNFEQIFEERWLNASVSMKSIEGAICAKEEQIAMDMKIIADLPEFGFEAMETYKTTLDIRTAMNEANRLAEMAKRKAEQEKKQQEEKETVKMPDGGVYVQDDDKQGFTYHEPASVEVSEDCENFIPDFSNKPEKKWVAMKVNLSSDDEKAFLQFMESRNIEFVVL